MNSPAASRYSPAEEIANSVTHAFGVVLSVTAFVFLTILAWGSGDAWLIVSLVIYGLSLVIMYTSSTLYHGFQNPGAKRILRYLDHSSIYLLIAGTYTPFTLVNLKGPWGWTLFGLVWGIAFVGLVMTVAGIGRSRVLASLVYIGMGWLVIVAIKPLLEVVPMRGIAWLVAGGLFYTVGVAFYIWRSLPFHHAVWHLFVLGGSVCHFFAVLFYVVPG